MQEGSWLCGSARTDICTLCSGSSMVCIVLSMMCTVSSMMHTGSNMTCIVAFVHARENHEPRYQKAQYLSTNITNGST